MQNVPVINHHDRFIQQDVHKQVHAELGKNQPYRGDIRAVEKKREDKGSAHFKENKRKKVNPVGRHKVTQCIRYRAAQQRHHRPVHHGAQRIDNKAKGDVHIRCDRDPQRFHRNPQGQDQRGKNQRSCVFQFSESLAPVIRTERRLEIPAVEGVSLHEKSLLSNQTC